MKKKLLLVLAELPYPATRNGLTLRYYPLIKELSRYMDVELICFNQEEEHPDQGDLAEYTSRITVLKRDRSSSSLGEKLISLFHMFSPFGTPHVWHNHDEVRLANSILEKVDSRYDSVLWVMPHLTRTYKLCRKNISTDRWVVDWVDSPTLNLSRAEESKGLWGRVMLEKTRRWEVKLLSWCDVGVYISPRDQQEVATRVSGTEMRVVPNGVFLEDYSSEAMDLPGPSIGFLGNMSYLPNVDAVHTLVRIHTEAKKEIPNLKLYIIGRDPLPEISQYGEDESVIVTGTVDSIWPWVNGVDLFVLPMSKGAGQQNKVLEIMYATKPVICSTVANGGVLAVDGESVIIQDDDAQCVQSVVELINDADKMAVLAQKGAEFVSQRYGWEGVGKEFYQCLSGTSESD